MKRILIVEDDTLLKKTLAYNLCRLIKLEHHRPVFVDEYTLTTSISRIRSKIEAEGDTYIKIIYGIGYQWTGGERK